MFMESDQILPGLSERSEQRGRQELKRQERRSRNTDGTYDYDDDDDTVQQGSYDSGYDDGGYDDGGYDEGADDEPDDSKRESFGQLMRTLADRFKKLF